jgi:hypothetical protein
MQILRLAALAQDDNIFSIAQDDNIFLLLKIAALFSDCSVRVANTNADPSTRCARSG